MSRKYVMMVTCSICGKQGTETDDLFYEATLSMDGVTYGYDFCDTCRDSKELLWLINKGVSTKVSKSKKPKAAAPADEPGAVSASALGSIVGIVTCPECQEPFKTEAGLAQHRSRKHDVLSDNAAEMAARGTGHLKCPAKGCKFGAKGNQGLSAHMRTNHGMSLADYRETLASA